MPRMESPAAREARLHAEADEARRRAIEAMTPWERMEEAFRLFKLGKGFGNLKAPREPPPS